MKYALCCVAAFALAGATLDAHGIWFAERSGQLALIYGEGAEDDAIVSRTASVSGLAVYDAKGSVVRAKLVTTDHLLFVETADNPAVITGVMDNGIWTVTGDGKEVNQPKRAVPGARSSGHYMKYAVHVRGNLERPLGALPGQTLQLTPTAPVLPSRMGDSITLRALYQGKPLANAQVIADFVNDPEGQQLRTGADGTVTLKVRNQGLNVISIVHETSAGQSQDTDKIQHRATLSFVLPPKSVR